jgi:hypothetical protein
VNRELADAAATFVGAKSSRRSFLVRVAVAGSALTVAPLRFILRPGTAYAAVCGPDASCGGGYTAMCCTVSGANRCPPGSFAAGWWKADNSGLCCGNAARYYIDCNLQCGQQCQCRCASGSCDERKVCCNVFRYGQCHQEIADNATAQHSAPCLPPGCPPPATTPPPAPRADPVTNLINSLLQTLGRVLSRPR